MRSAVDAIQKMIAPVKRQIALAISRGVIKFAKDTGAIQVVQVSLLKDEVRDRVERFQEYGFTSNPKPGAEALVVFINGNRDHGIILGVEDRRHRKKNLESGEVALYTDEGDSLHFKRSRQLHARANKFKFQGETYELMEQLRELAQRVEEIAGKLSTTTTNTMLGPMQLNDFSYFAEKKTQAEAIKNHIAELKV